MKKNLLNPIDNQIIHNIFIIRPNVRKIKETWGEKWLLSLFTFDCAGIMEYPHDTAGCKKRIPDTETPLLSVKCLSLSNGYSFF